MTVVKITGQGLSAIALSVTLLWACLLGERAIALRAELDRARALHEIELLQQRQHPESHPVSVPNAARRARPTSA